MLGFVHIEKCGGTTLIDILRRNFVLDHCDAIPRNTETMLLGHDDLKDILRLRPGVKSLAGHSLRLACGFEALAPNIRYYTCLRDPVKRFLSEYHYFVEHFGCTLDFKQWLDSGERSNFQTVAIAGEANLDKAKQVLEEKFSGVGLLEQFDEFLAALKWLAREDLGFDLDIRYQVQNTREQRKTKAAGENPLDRYRDEIRAANAMDIALYDFAKTVLIPRQREKVADAGIAVGAGDAVTDSFWTRCDDARRRTVYLMYRNLVYKPYMGYWPAPHWLPVYRDMAKAG